MQHQFITRLQISQTRFAVCSLLDEIKNEKCNEPLINHAQDNVSASVKFE